MPPCVGDVGFGQPVNATTASCCASGHETFPAVAFDPGRISPERGHDLSPPEPFVLSRGWLRYLRLRPLLLSCDHRPAGPL